MKAIALLVLALGCAACGESSNEVTGPTSSAVPIGGRVIQFFSRDTAAGATIEFRTTNGSPVTSTTTDANGNYSATLPRGGEYLLFINGIARGNAYVGDTGYRGDLLVDDGRCVVRYGTITDPAGRPLANALVSIGALSAVSAHDGWYSIEFGCAGSGTIGGTTVPMNVSLNGHASFGRVFGPGLAGVQRFDVALGKLTD